MYSKLPQRPYVCHYGKLRCGKPVFPDVRFGCGSKESPGVPGTALVQDAPTQHAFIPLQSTPALTICSHCLPAARFSSSSQQECKYLGKDSLRKT